MLDYGQVKDLPENLRLGYAKLILAIADGNATTAKESFKWETFQWISCYNFKNSFLPDEATWCKILMGDLKSLKSQMFFQKINRKGSSSSLRISYSSVKNGNWSWLFGAKPTTLGTNNRDGNDFFNSITELMLLQ